MELKIRQREIGDLVLDATLSESHNSDTKITDNPIESGALITDHQVMLPKKISIKGLVVDYEPPFFSLPIPDNLPFADSAKRLLNILPPLSVDLPSVAFKAKNLVAEFKGISNFVKSQSDTLAPFLPDFSIDPLGIGSGGNRIGEYHNKLLEMQRSGNTIEITTGTRKYTNMLIQSVGVAQRDNGSAEFTITAREVFIVDLLSFDVTKTPLGKVANGRAGTNSSQAVHKNVQPQSVSKEKSKAISESFLSSTFGG